MKKHVKIAITIIASIVEILFYVIYFDLLSPVLNNPNIINTIVLLFPSGLLYLFNYFVLSPLVIWIICKCQDIIGFRSLVNKIDSVISGGVQWFSGMHVKWAPFDSSRDFENDHRIANMFEVMLSMFTTGWYKRKPSLFGRKENFLYSACSEYGWYSRTLGTSLGNETVVCTSLGLFLFGQHLNKVDDKEKIIKMNKVAERLWDMRTDDGWGVFLIKHPPYECRLANTFWALRALSIYENIYKKQEYVNYVKSIFEKATDSLFGFHVGDTCNLIVTAMYLLLYFEMPESIKNQIQKIYNPSKAVSYVYKKFCIENIQCESEDLPGIKMVDKVPWQHITVSYAIQSLCMAYNHKMLKLLQFQALSLRINNLLSNDVKTISENACYYKPKGMQINPKGMNTFPTAYLLIGINAFKEVANLRKNAFKKVLCRLNTKNVRK